MLPNRSNQTSSLPPLPLPLRLPQAYPLSVRRSLMSGYDPLPDVILAALSR
jgi:hypothetical protein